MILENKYQLSLLLFQLAVMIVRKMNIVVLIAIANKRNQAMQPFDHISRS